MNQLVRFDTASLNRVFLGFDTLFNDLETRIANQVNNNYPPYNFLKHDDDSYEIQIAVSGFEADEITVEVDQDQLIVKGERNNPSDEDTTYLHRGLAGRDFVRTWTLAEHIVVGEGHIKNGILTVALNRVVPEALKPRTIKITAE